MQVTIRLVNVVVAVTTTWVHAAVSLLTRVGFLCKRASIYEIIITVALFNLLCTAVIIELYNYLCGLINVLLELKFNNLEKKLFTRGLRIPLYNEMKMIKYM